MAFSDLFKKKKDSKSPSKAGAEGGTEGSISADIIPFLNIIAKNSLALPGMARDMNVLRQNIVKLVKLKNAEAITKADKFFKTEDKREAELEDARKKEAPTQVKNNDKGKSKKEDKSSDEEGIAEYLFKLLGKTLAALFLGIGMGIAAAFDLGKLIDTIKEKLNPMPMLEGLFESIKNVWKQITESDIDTALASVGLSHLKNQSAMKLSAGERQRLSLARAKLQQPRVILLDEPTANLDPSTTEHVEAIIKNLALNGCGVIFTSHHLGQVQSLSDQVVFLADGQCLEVSNTENFFKHPQSEQAKKFIARELGWK